jgi:hypothetical protein
MDKMQALQQHFEAKGMLHRFGFSPNFGNTTNHDADTMLRDDSEGHEDKDVSEFDIQLATRTCAYPHLSRVPHCSIVNLAECGYPSWL